MDAGGSRSTKSLTENYLGGKAEFVSDESVGTVSGAPFPSWPDRGVRLDRRGA
jgi:hypothetical protein